MAWDQDEVDILRKSGLTQEQIGVVLGRLAEHRMQADNEGYIRGYHNGKLDWKGAVGDSTAEEREEVLEAIANFYLDKHKDNPTETQVDRAERDIRELALTNISVLPSGAKKIVMVRLERPGLLIGKRGANIEALGQYLNADVRLVETNSVTSEITKYIPYIPEYELQEDAYEEDGGAEFN